MSYVDGFLLALPKKNKKAYLGMAKLASKVWMGHGALEYRECLGEDLKIKGTRSFLKAAGAKTGETVVFAWIVYRSKKHRDQVNAKVMKDPRILKMMKKKMPMDPKRMYYGGFDVAVEA
jgi:uncharacterized protein YbaA (DUF1428 family)